MGTDAALQSPTNDDCADGACAVRRFATDFDPNKSTPARDFKVFNNWLIGLIVSLLSVGTAVGCLIGAPLSDRIGRRWAMFWETIIFDIGVIIQVTSFQAWYQVAIGR